MKLCRLAAGMAVRAAEAEDWGEEYLRLCIAIRVVAERRRGD